MRCISAGGSWRRATAAMRGRERGESGEGERTLRGKSLKAAQKLYPTSTSTTLYEIENENLHFTSQGAEARGNVEKKQ